MLFKPRAHVLTSSGATLDSDISSNGKKMAFLISDRGLTRGCFCFCSLICLRLVSLLVQDREFKIRRIAQSPHSALIFHFES